MFYFLTHTHYILAFLDGNLSVCVSRQGTPVGAALGSTQMNESDKPQIVFVC